MKARILSFLNILSLFAVLFTVSCKKDPQQTSLDKLKEKGYAFTLVDYLKSASAGDLDAVKLFRESGMAVDVADERGITALMRASVIGADGVVKELIAAGADVNKTDLAGNTPLLLAASGGHVTTIDALLEARANPMKRDRDGFNPLTKATFHGHFGAVERLAPVSRDHLDQALQLASVKGDVAIMGLLLGNGASVFSRSREDKTPLMYAASQGRLDAVNLLLQEGATRQATSEGKTAAELALASGHQEIHDLLMDPTYTPTGVKGGGAMAEMVTKPGGEELAKTSLVPEVLNGTTPELADGASPVAGNTLSPVAGNTPSTDVGNGATTGSGSIPPEMAEPVERIDGKILPDPKPRKVATMGNTPVAPVTLPEHYELKRYEETEMPVRLSAVQGSTAQVVVRQEKPVAGEPPVRTVPVVAGQKIPGTTYQVTAVTPRSMVTKESRGQAVDVSEITVKDESTGRDYRVVKDQVARTDQTRAVIRDPDTGKLFDVRAGDEFSAKDGTRYRVLDIRSNAVMIEDLNHGGTYTVDRG